MILKIRYVWYQRKNLKWFHSYLTNRKEFIKCRDQNTDLEVLRCGVPQGSILGPLLFLSACDSIPLRLPTLTFNSIEIKRESSVKFVGVIIDENITWNKYIELVENKISKNTGILYRASHYLDRKCLKSIYFSFIH